MGTSFTEYGRAGFWTRDAALEAVLALLEPEDDETNRIWLCAALCELLSDRSVEAARREIASGSVETLRELDRNEVSK